MSPKLGPYKDKGLEVQRGRWDPQGERLSVSLTSHGRLAKREC